MNIPVLVTTFFAAAIEVIEMVAIVVGDGSTRSWRAALVGAAGVLVVLAVLITAVGTALRTVPLASIRLVVGALLLVFGLQWLRKGVRLGRRPSLRDAKRPHGGQGSQNDQRRGKFKSPTSGATVAGSAFAPMGGVAEWSCGRLMTVPAW